MEGILFEYASKIIWPEYNYINVLLEFSVLYILYSLYKVSIKKFIKHQAYAKITRVEKISNEENVKKPKQSTQEKQEKSQKQGKKKNSEKEQQQQKDAQKQQNKQESQQQKQENHSNISYKELLKQEKHNKSLQNKEKQKSTGKITHPLYLSSVKGFSDYITDFAYNNRYLIATGFDNSIKLFEMEQFFKNPDQPKYLFHTLNDTHATAICISKKEEIAYFSANNQLFNLEFYPKAEDKQYFKVIPKTKNCHKSDINSLHVDENDKILISTSSDTHIKVWNMKGELLKEINTSYGEHYSSCFMKGFLVVSSWSVDTSIYEIKFNKDHTFRTLEKEEVLRGEKTSVLDASLNEHGTLATLCNKSQCRVYRLNTERKLKEDAKLLTKVELQNISAAAVNENILVVAADGNVHVYDRNFQQIDQIDNAANGAYIKRVRIHELHSSLKNKNFYVCFVWGQEEERINVYNFTKYHE
ncbi:unnamed protein product (macronuclear) [Paramecium tetraurelia]|uniref:Uncharacterized protein n=1 Tax=Paramecium tetraurelia TaxID=5888 RepID=A0DQB4_PARTE|nr:uncharacterized protein GSPATT00002631001 [Paramecium tetraurelia]CAK85231.1 unnamed protein product [Paramecium tetraurelia]|eukprot:XP_001452628.1 hypothetical protein (macronuclear) [Paramecium tetraurelia strain d4-2]